MPAHILHSVAVRRRRLAPLAAALAAAGLVATAPPAMAGTYHHLTLNYGGYANTDGWTSSMDTLGLGYHASVILSDGSLANWNVGGGRSSYTAGEYTAARYTAPANTTLARVFWTNRLSGLTSGPWHNTVSDAVTNLLPTSSPSNGMNVYDANASGTALTFRVGCTGPSSCTAAPDAYYRVDTVDIALNDLYAPQAGAPAGTLKDNNKIAGDATISYSATDQGSGLYRTVFYDGSEVVSRSVVHSNGGTCADVGGRNFERQVPCLLSATAGATLDTNVLADGNHTIKVAVADASGNETTVYGPVTKTVANHPPANTARPLPISIAAFKAAAQGVPLAFAKGGEWTGPNLVMSYAWVRCDANGDGCVQIPGFTSLTYTPTTDDLGHTVRLAATATNVADSVTVYSDPSGVVTAPKSAESITPKPTNGAPGADGKDGANGLNALVTVPGLPSANTINNTHTLIGRVAGEPAGVACPGDKATLRFQHVKGGQMNLRFGRASTAQLELTCTNTGKAIADAKLEIATKTGAHAAVAADVTTDGAGHATIRLAKGASRGIAVGYRMYADDTMARATATLKVLVKGRVALKADRKRLHNGQAVTLRGSLAGGEVPKRGVALAVQWKDGNRWRPFAQIKTNKKGQFRYAYRFTRTKRTIKYQLRVQVGKGQVDYPYLAATSKPVKVTVAP